MGCFLNVFYDEEEHILQGVMEQERAVHWLGVLEEEQQVTGCEFQLPIMCYH